MENTRNVLFSKSLTVEETKLFYTDVFSGLNTPYIFFKVM